MERKFKITVDGRPYNVTVEELSDNPTLLDVGPARTALPIPSLAPVGLPPAQPVLARATAEPGDVVSSLGGVVDSIAVAVGEDVKEGDRLLVLEAMKMKTPITAHRSGQVLDILVKAGDGVQSGQVLVKLS